MSENPAIPRTCKYFSPSDPPPTKGAVQGDHYPFAQGMPYSSCWHPELGGSEASPRMCEFANQHKSCGFYSPEQMRVLRWVAVKAVEGFTHLLLDTVRFGPGIGEYRILSWNEHTPEPTLNIPPEVQQLLTVNTWRDPNAAKVATEAFDQRLHVIAPNEGEIFVDLAKQIRQPKKFLSKLPKEVITSAS